MVTFNIIGLLCLFNVVHGSVEVQNPAIDSSLFESVLDTELCNEQLQYITLENPLLRLQFLDAGLRLPRGILTGNFVDLGNYHQCLEINQALEEYEVSGKYCLIDIPFDQNIQLPSLPEIPEISWPEWLPRPNSTYHDTDNLEKIKNFQALINRQDVLLARGHTFDESPAVNLSSFNMRLAMCIPRPCTTQQALANLYFNMSAIGLKYNDVYCRLPDDKKWVAADTVATTILSCIGLITILSTAYDIYHTVIKKRDAKEVNQILTSFSVYTNTRTFFTFKSRPGTIECLDGIRALAMAWVIMGHTFFTVANFPMYNLLDVADWVSSTKSLWIQAGPLSVDTFFMLSGLLLVYTTAGKFTGIKLLKNLHLFYLHRLLRLFPLLAFAILLEISYSNRISDGPLWTSTIVPQVNNCRTNWWATLLHVQNYVVSGQLCLPHSWYVTIDTHLHILSPIVLFWVLSGKKSYSWIALTAGLIISLTASSIYVFLKNFSIITTATPEESTLYMRNFYINTLTRAPPFFIGMIFGYVLHTYRGKKMRIPKVIVALLWILACVLSSMAVYSLILDKKLGYDNQTLENFKHAYNRSIWALAVGWMILACIHGYSGPINWFLSLEQWKPLSRLSYGMYLLHFAMMYVHAGSRVSPGYFSVPQFVYIFLSHFMYSCIISFVATVVVDAPFATLVKLALGGGPKRPTENEEKIKISETNGLDNHAFTRTESKNE